MKIVCWNVTMFSLGTIVQKTLIKEIRKLISAGTINEAHVNHNYISNYDLSDVPRGGQGGRWTTINLGQGRRPKVICIAEIAMGGDIETVFRNRDIESPSDIFVLIEPQHNGTLRGLAAVKILTSVMPSTETQEWKYTYRIVSESEIIAVLYNAKAVQADFVELTAPEAEVHEPEASHSSTIPLREDPDDTSEGWSKALQVNFNFVQTRQERPPPFTLVAVHSARRSAEDYATRLFEQLAARLSDTQAVPPLKKRLIVCGDFNCSNACLTRLASRFWPNSNHVGVKDTQATTLANNSFDHFLTIPIEGTSHPDTAPVSLLTQLEDRLGEDRRFAGVRYRRWFSTGDDQHAHLPISWEHWVATTGLG